MKKAVVTFAIVFCTVHSWAQIQPGSQPNTNLPAPKPKLLAPPDLQVTAINFVSITREADHSLVRLSITIKNNGGIRAGATKLKGYEAWARDGRPGGWKPVATTPDVVAINPGQSLTGEYVFRVNNLTADKKFAMKVMADGILLIPEGNEANNTSGHIIITPPLPTH